MTRHFDDDLSLLKQNILRMGGMVEEAVRNATTALIQRRPELAHLVVDADDTVDKTELDVDEECLRVLALHQPVAGDLRFITATMMINHELERIGDLAVNVAERAIDLVRQEPLAVPLDFEQMAELVRSMLHDCLEALVNRNAALARDVCLRDDEVDEMHARHFSVLQECMKQDPRAVERAVGLLSVSRQLERIADQATNIAEDVVFMVKGVVIRHSRLA